MSGCRLHLPRGLNPDMERLSIGIDVGLGDDTGLLGGAAVAEVLVS